MKNYIPVEVYPLVESTDWMKLTGELPVKMTNDYLFRALLQSDNDTLKSLLASVLRIRSKEIKSAKVTNPILLGEAVGDKIFIMDVKVEFNNDSLIDLEMQVIKERGWEDRSLSYICRSYDQLNAGMVYSQAKPVRQIAFCDFTLFEDYPEFFANYKLINVRNKESVYTEKFIISNINLTRPDLATQDDKEYGLDEWCRMFKAETWEDMKMLAKNNAVMGKAISGIWQLTEEEKIREQCRAREEWLINDKWKTDMIEELSREKEEWLINDKWKTDMIEQQSQTITGQQELIKDLQKSNKDLQKSNKDLQDQLKMLKEANTVLKSDMTGLQEQMSVCRSRLLRSRSNRTAEVM